VAARLRGDAIRSSGPSSTASDLDLLVTLGEGRSLLDLVGLKQDLEDLYLRHVLKGPTVKRYASAAMLG